MSDVARVAIVNTALFQLGKPPIADLSEASLRQSAAGLMVNRALDTSRETVLRRHGWLCALTYVWLQPATIPNDRNWKYRGRYELPGGALRVWEVRTPPLEPFFEEIDWISFGMLGPPLIEGERWEVNTIDAQGGGSRLVLRSDICHGLPVSYVRTANWSALDAHIADAIAWDAASRCAWTVTGDRGVQADLVKAAEGKVLMAISVDGTQEGGQYPVAPSITARIRLISR